MNRSFLADSRHSKGARNPIARAILWLGAAFLSYQLLSYLFTARSANWVNIVQSKLDAERAAAIKEAYRFSWDNYERYAFPHDTLLPLQKTFEDDRQVPAPLKILHER